ncbi:proline--tRNA ligase [Clostridioides difficile]|uniref:proline--tRNA ligase n=1 Tax=Clostridioides difficile TaxID=1496 RepID=UPI000BB1F214|nr:proline--tRNA ligase [Clostridioides difficile]EJX2681597.1 proline--tRNA ligase [Clostridioides difficile]MBY2206775.1 proline--tRNA ligase [Clostridioides difficile]MBZ0593187.1 proline--tRNA ligase [Clostridioides difficile]MBZ1158346.1 proline--tRNA ligase [Clostridioides difficile]MCE4650685.1 proline--tRNA ligase [Clostridioides difficile]
MFFISDIYTKSPIKFDIPLQKEAYKILQKLDVDFECVDTDEAITMEDCVQINKKLNMKMVI